MQRHDDSLIRLKFGHRWYIPLIFLGDSLKNLHGIDPKLTKIISFFIIAVILVIIIEPENIKGLTYFTAVLLLIICSLP